MNEIARTGITYNVTLEDMIAFNLFHHRSSPTIQALYRRNLIFGTLAVVVLTAVVSYPLNSPLLLHLIGATIAGVLFAGYMLYMQKRGFVGRIGKLAKKLYAEEKNPATFGERTLEVDEEGFTHTTAYSQTRCAWGNLVKIESEPGYTYLFTGAASAIVVPHNAITQGDFKAALEKISAHYHPEKKLAQ